MRARSTSRYSHGRVVAFDVEPTDKAVGLASTQAIEIGAVEALNGCGLGEKVNTMFIIICHSVHLFNNLSNKMSENKYLFCWETANLEILEICVCWEKVEQIFVLFKENANKNCVARRFPISFASTVLLGKNLNKSWDVNKMTGMLGESVFLEVC